MKSVKFLAALAVPAMFAACTNEELVAVQQEAQQVKEFVGAELVGTGITMDFGTEVGSRLYGSTWSDTDKLGLGWVVAGEYGDAQSSDVAPTEEELYGNHMFYKGEDGSFTSKGNIYKGWHFAYYPYAYMEELGEQKVININPVQTEVWDTDRYNTGFYLSARKFLSKADLDENYQLKEKKFEMVRANNTIGVTIKPSATFTSSEVLKNLAVKSIKLTVDKGVFSREVNVNPTKLPEFQYDEDGVYASTETKDAVKVALSQVLTPKNSLYKAVTTTVENDNINLSGDQTLRIHTLASAATTINPLAVKFTIEVEGGKFEVATVAGEATDEEANNNATILKLVNAYKKDGAMTVPGGVLYDKENDPFNLILTADMFEANFTNIQSEEEWNTAVKVADALGMEEAEFVIAKNAQGKNWAFADVDGDNTLINLPEAELTVSGESMILAADGEWPAEGLTVNTDVIVNADLTVADGVAMEATKIINNATIKAGKKSEIKSVENNSRIEVVYGSYVEVKQDKTGTIAYEVLKSGETPARINTLINGGNNGKYARVNTLVINEGVTFDLMMSTTTSSEEDPYYEGVTTTDFVTDLKDINIEMNGGTIKGEQELTKTVKNIEVISGTNTIMDVNILNDLSVKEGAKVTVDATAHSINLIKHDVVVGNDIVNDGSITADVNIITKNIDNENGKAVVNKGYTIWYTNAYIQGGIAQGNILKASWNGTSEEPQTSTEGGKTKYTVMTASELVWLAQQDKVNSAIIELGANIDMAGVNWTKGIHAGDGDYETVVNGNGYTISNLNGTSGLFEYSVGEIKNLNIDGAKIRDNDFIGALANNTYASISDVTVKNVTVNGTKRVGAVIGIHNGGKIENCTVENALVTGDCYSGGVISGMVNETVANRIYKNITVKNSKVETSVKGALTGLVNGVTMTAENIVIENTTPSTYVGKFASGGELE